MSTTGRERGLSVTEALCDWEGGQAGAARGVLCFRRVAVREGGGGGVTGPM